MSAVQYRRRICGPSLGELGLRGMGAASNSFLSKNGFLFIATRNPTGVVVRSLLSKEKLWFFTMWGGVVGDRPCGIRLITVSSYFFFIQT